MKEIDWVFDYEEGLEYHIGDIFTISNDISKKRYIIQNINDKYIITSIGDICKDDFDKMIMFGICVIKK